MCASRLPDGSRGRPRKGRSLGTRILAGVLAGTACGIFFGELSAPLRVAGTVYIRLLEMTVLPFVTVSLVSKIGSLTFGAAKRLAGRAGLILLALWVIALVTVLVMPLSLPKWEAGTFFTSSLVERPKEFDFLGLYVPTNPFYSLANNIVPAAVLFSILLGVALIAVPHRERVLDPLEVVGDMLSRISDFVVRLAPWGTFALAAGAAGTLSPGQLTRLAGYVSSFTVASLFLTFLVLPSFVAALTPFRFGQILAGFRDAILTAFATGKLFAVLPMVAGDVRRLLVGEGVPTEEAEAAADVFVPLAYPFPNAGRILSLLFIPFAAWFVGRPLGLADYPFLLSVGLLSLFGSPVAAIPFLLDLLRLPADLFPLFLVAGIWCARLGDMLGAMHLAAFTLLTAAWNRNWLALRPARVMTWLAGFILVGTVAVAGNYFLVRGAIAGQPPPRSLVESMDLLDEMTTIEEDDEAGPNPLPFAAGESRLQRIQRAGELRAGYRPQNPPFSYRNGKGRLVGLDIDLVQRLAAELDVTLRLVPYAREKLTEAFQADRFDLAVGGIASSIDNFGRFHESGPYLSLHLALLVPDYRAREFESLDAIRAKGDKLRIGFVAMSYLARTGRHRFPGLDVVPLASVETYLRGERPDVDALLTTAETGAVLAMLHPAYSVVLPKGARARVPLVFAVQRTDDLDRLVDTWLRLKEADGTIDELYAHWILGERPRKPTHRWSVIQDVLGWVD